jgi:flagellar basal-body rod protein FlgB
MLIKNHLFKSRVPLLNSALDAYALRQNTISKNIANINTPHYKPESVKFEEQFQNQFALLSGENGGSMGNSPSSTDVFRSEKTVAPIPEAEVYFSGETSVNIDKELGELARNQIRTRFASQMLSKYFRGLGSAITGQQSAT